MKTVLYIDDSPDDLFLFSKACEAAGVLFRLKVADGSDVGLEYLGGAGEYTDRNAYPVPDFVLLDIKMPEMDGFEVLNWIRTHPKVSRTMVALYSSSTVNKDVLRGYLTGTTYYIPKCQGMDRLRELALGLDDCVNSGGKDCSRLLNLSIDPAHIITSPGTGWRELCCESHYPMKIGFHVNGMSLNSMSTYPCPASFFARPRRVGISLWLLLVMFGSCAMAREPFTRRIGAWCSRPGT